MGWNNKIGNYIHWSYRNYVKFGLGTTKLNGDKSNPYEVFFDLRKRMLEEARAKAVTSNSDLKTLEDSLNFFTVKDRNTIGNFFFTEEEKAKMANELAKIINEDIKKYGAEISADDILNGNLSAEGVSSAGLSKKFSPLLGYVGGTGRAEHVSVSTESVKNRFLELQKTYSRIMGDINKTDDEEELANKIDLLFAKFGGFKDAIDSIGGEGSTFGIQSLSKMTNNSYSDLKSFLDELNDVCRHAKSNVLTHVKGIIGEDFTALASYVYILFLREKGKDFSKERIESLFRDAISVKNSAVVGNQRSANILLSSNIAILGGSYGGKKATKTDYGTVGQHGEFVSSFGFGKARFNYTLDKVDCELSFISEKPIQASIKNINLYSAPNVTLLKGNLILNYVLEYGLFMNHYFNVVATLRSEEMPPVLLVYAANKALALTLAYKALAGGVYSLYKDGEVKKSKESEIFIAYNKDGRAKIIRNIDLMDSFYDLGERIFDVVQMEQFNLNYRMAQEYQFDSKGQNYNAAYKRIYKLLGEFHNSGIKISFSSKYLLNNYINSN